MTVASLEGVEVDYARGRALGPVDLAVAEGETVTYDLGGTAGTREFGEAVAARVRATG